MGEFNVLKNVAGRSLLYGNTVYFTESGESVPYILVHSGNSKNFLFMRKYATADKVSYFAEATDLGVSDSERIYENHTLDNFMKNDFYGRFTKEWQRIFVDNSVVVTRASDGLQYSIKRKVFAPSATELGVGEQTNGTVPTESPFGAYRYFSTNAQNKRKCQVGGSNGNYVEWWTRSKNNHTGNTFNYYALSIDKNGGYDTGTWQINSHYVRPVISINENVTVLSSNGEWRIIPNLPPETPSGSIKRITVRNGEQFEISWKQSVDEDGPTEPKYLVQASIDSGEWVDVVETKETVYAKILSYKEADASVKYRVCAYDNYQNASEFVEIADVVVVNNLPPSAPSFITVTGKYKNESVAVTWGNATDEDENLKGYNVYRSVDNGSYSLVSETATNVFRETAGNWETVKYKVHSIDEIGDESIEYVESAVSLSDKITMSVDISEDSGIQEGSVITHETEENEASTTLKFVISDTQEGGLYTGSAIIDNKELLGYFQDISAGEVEFDIPIELWRTISNGTHSIVIEVDDRYGFRIEKTVSFEKQTKVAVFTLAEPVTIESDSVVRKYLINVEGNLPEGSSLVVEVTNNANDSSPVWQTVPAEMINSGSFAVFGNTSAANGNAFNFRVKAHRGTAKEKCYISSVNGMFGENIFEYILARLDALEGG